MNENQSLLAALALIGAVVFLTRRHGRGELGAEAMVQTMKQQGLIPGGPVAPGSGRPRRPEITNGNRRMLPAIRGRRTARKLWGSGVLASQASASLKKLAITRNDPSLSNLAAKLQQISNELVSKAHLNDAAFVKAKLARMTSQSL